MKTLTFLLSTIIELYTMILLLYIWIQLVHCDLYNPFVQFVIRILQPIINPLHRIIPNTNNFDSVSLLLALILCIVKAIILFAVVTFQFIIWIAAMLILIKTIGFLIFWIILIKMIMNWVNQRCNPVEHALTQMTEPLLCWIRSLLPSITGIDLSPMILIMILYIINMGIGEILQSTDNILLHGLWIII